MVQFQVSADDAIGSVAVRNVGTLLSATDAALIVVTLIDGLPCAPRIPPIPPGTDASGRDGLHPKVCRAHALGIVVDETGEYNM